MKQQVQDDMHAQIRTQIKEKIYYQIDKTISSKKIRGRLSRVWGIINSQVGNRVGRNIKSQNLVTHHQ